MSKHALLPLCILLLGLTCLKAGQRPDFWPLNIGSKTYPRMELALTDQEVRRGLMFRKSLPSDAGMLFVFQKEQPLAFWMKNTLIPLDILFVDASGTVVTIHTMKVEPPPLAGEADLIYEMRLPTYPSAKDAQFVIELNAGEAQKADIRVGTAIDLDSARLLRLQRQAQDTP